LSLITQLLLIFRIRKPLWTPVFEKKSYRYPLMLAALSTQVSAIFHIFFLVALVAREKKTSVDMAEMSQQL